MFGSTKTTRNNIISPILRWALLAAALVIMSPLSQGQVALAADAPKAATEEKSDPADTVDLNAIREQLRRLGEAIRRAMDDAARTFDSKPGGSKSGGGAPRDGGLGGLAPKVRPGELHDVYGPGGPTVRSVRALLQYRLVLLGNQRLKAGRIYERDKRIIAEVVTAREGALVTRYMINKTTGIWVPEG